MSHPGFAVTADTHLRRCTWANRPQLVGDSYAAFRHVVDRCVAGKMNLVVAGDIFDVTRPPSESVRFFQQQTDRLYNSDLNVFVVDGNHDRVDAGDQLPDHLRRLQDAGTSLTPSWTELCPGVTIVDGIVFEPCPGVTAYGLSFRDRVSLEKALADVPPGVDVLVGHQMVNLAMGLPGQWQLDADAVPAHLKLVLLGDYHKPVDWVLPTGARLIYPGCPFTNKLDETHPKSFVVVRPDLTLGRESIPERTLVTVDLRTAEQLDAFVGSAPADLSADKFAHLPSEIRTPLLRVTYRSDLPAAAARIETAVAGLANVWPVADDVAFSASVVESAADDTASILAEEIDPVTEPDAFALALSLISDADPAAAIIRLRAQYGVAPVAAGGR